MKSLTVDTINTLSEHRSVNFHMNLNYVKLEIKLTRFRKKNSGFPDNLREELDEKFSLTQKDCQHTEFYPCVKSFTTNFNQPTRDVYEKCCPTFKKSILIKGKCNKRYNTESKIAKRNIRRAEKKYRQVKTNKFKHNELPRLRQLKCESVTRTKSLYYMKKLNECGNGSSKIYGQVNILLGKNKNSNILPSGKLPLPLANDFKIFFFIDKIDKIMRGFRKCRNSKDIFPIPDFPLNTMFLLEPVPIEQIFTFMKNL